MRGTDEVGRRTSATYDGNKIQKMASGAGSSAEALHRLQCSQGWLGTGFGAPSRRFDPFRDPQAANTSRRPWSKTPSTNTRERPVDAKISALFMGTPSECMGRQHTGI